MAIANALQMVHCYEGFLYFKSIFFGAEDGGCGVMTSQFGLGRLRVVQNVVT